MAASFKFNGKLPVVFRKYFIETVIKNEKLREITTCSICLAKSKQRYKKKNDPTLQTGEVSHNIVVPRKIERTPTSILEALASTVKYDSNQPMYLSVDDPHLLPVNDRMKKTHMASKDNGRKAAQMMLSLYPDYFTQIWQDALPEAYTNDPYQGYQHKEPSEAALNERIKSKQIKDAIDVYKTCKKKGTSLSQHIQEDLLELLTVYNCQEPDKSSDLSHYIVPNYELHFRFPKNNWLRGNQAEEVFSSLPEKTVTAYNMLLRGTAANYDEEASFKLYNEMKEKNISVDLYTYNKLMALAQVNQQSVEDVIQIVQSIFQDMRDSEVHPNVETFNAALGCFRIFTKWAKTHEFVLSLFTEMVSCGIEPQLSTFDIFMNIFYYQKDKSRKLPDLLESMLKFMEGKEYEIESIQDVSFFRTAIKSLVTHFPDSSYALRLHKILTTGNNFKALGHRQFAYGYYADLFSIITPLEHTDVVMDIYQSVVPHIFLPAVDLYIQILENIKMNETYHYVPQLYADLYLPGSLNQDKLFDAFVECMATKKQETELQEKFAVISSSLIENYCADREVGKKGLMINGLDGSSIGNMILIFLNNGEPEKAINAYKLYRGDENLQRSEPSSESLTQLTKHCITVKDYNNVSEFLSSLLTIDRSKVPEMVDILLTTAEPTELSEQERNFYLGLAQEASPNKEKKRGGKQKI